LTENQHSSLLTCFVLYMLEQKMQNNINSIYLKSLDKYEAILQNIEGLSNSEINSIEEKFNVNLPTAYKDFLKILGKKCGSILSSYYMNYPILMENKQDAIYALNFDNRNKYNHNLILKDTFFFFAQWQGYVFYFFDCEEKSENPPVYIFRDDLTISKYKNSFSEFLIDEIALNLNP
jgi:SMI1-KNR4 cell-wall